MSTREATAVLITGATGTVGRPLMRELARRGVRARALVRDRSRATDLRALGHEPVVASFEDADSLQRAMRGVARVFVLSPPGVRTMVDWQTRAVDAAAEAGVIHVVKLSSISADEDTEARIIRAHGEIERHIEASGLAWTHLRPNAFMQNELGQAAAIGVEHAFYAPDVTAITPVDARDVAAIAARVLAEDGHENRAYVLTGPEALTYADIAERYSLVLGHAVRWIAVSLESARAWLVDAGLPEELATGFTEIMSRYRAGGVTARVSCETAALLGRPPTEFAQFVRDHVTAYRPAAVSAPHADVAAR